MNKMIEKVAEAIAEADCDYHPTKLDYLDMAKAAIEAMREPTEGMIEVAKDNAKDDDVAWEISAWHVMIDYLLKE